MIRLLYVKASPRPESRSVAVADAYLAALRSKHPDLVVDTIALWDEPLPTFDGDSANAKLAVITGQDHSAAQKTKWDAIVAIIERFKAADVYLLAVPMWNGGIPYRLKQYIDIVHQPGQLFGLDPSTGYFGLLKNKKAVVAYTSGAFSRSAPSPAFGVDHQSTYLRAWLNQAGVTDITEIRYQPTLLDPDSDAAFARAKAEAAVLAGHPIDEVAPAPLDLVRAFYAAIAGGDVPAMLSLLHPDLEWTEAEGFPYYSGTWRRPEDVVEKLLAPLMRDWDGFAVTPEEFVGNGDRFVTLGAYSGTSKATGRTMRAPFAHVWRIADSKLKRFDMYTNTLLVQRALEPR